MVFPCSRSRLTQCELTDKNKAPTANLNHASPQWLCQSSYMQNLMSSRIRRRSIGRTLDIVLGFGLAVHPAGLTKFPALSSSSHLRVVWDLKELEARGSLAQLPAKGVPRHFHLTRWLNRCSKCLVIALLERSIQDKP